MTSHHFSGLCWSQLTPTAYISHFTDGSVVEKPPTNAGDMGSIPGSGRSPGGGKGSPLQYSCLENSMDRRAWWAVVHGVVELDTTESLSTPNMFKDFRGQLEAHHTGSIYTTENQQMLQIRASASCRTGY